MSKIFKILIIISIMMTLTSCDGLLCEMGSATACSRYNYDVWNK